MLRDTAGEQGYVRYKPVGEMSFSIPPSLRATSPMANATQGRSLKMFEAYLAHFPCGVP